MTVNPVEGSCLALWNVALLKFRLRRLCLFFAAAAAASALYGFPSQSLGEQNGLSVGLPPNLAPQITVVARGKLQIQRFINNVGINTEQNQLSRRQGTICINSYGLIENYNDLVRGTVEDIARKLHIDVSQNGRCDGHIEVLFFLDGRGGLAAIFKAHPEIFDFVDPSANHAELPILWRYGLAVAPADGSANPIRCARTVCKTVIFHARDSHLLATAVDQIASCFAFVNVDALGEIKLQGVADYVAMVCLAQVSQSGSFPGANTILNMFADQKSGKAPPVGLTAWDLAYLRGLYRSDTASGTMEQRQQIEHEFSKMNEAAP